MSTQNKIAIIIIFAGFTALMWFSPNFARFATGGESAPGTHTQQMPEQRTLPETDRPVFVEFYSDDCGICQRLKPGIAELEDDFDGRVDFLHIDTNALENQLLIRQFEVYSLPSLFIVTPEKEIVYGHEGLVSIEALRARLETIAQEYSPPGPAAGEDT